MRWAPAWVRWTAVVLAAMAFYAFGARTGALQPWYTDETSYYTIYSMQLAQQIVLGEATEFVTVFPSGYSLVVMVVYGAFYIAGRMAGDFKDATDFLVHYAVHREDFVVLARWVSAAFAALALPGMYLASRRLFSAPAAVAATVGLAVCYPVVSFAHTAANITMLVCLSAWTLYWIVRVWQEGSLRAYLWTGAWIGAGIGTKYYPIAWFLSLALASWYRIREGAPAKIELGRLAAAGAVSIPVTFLFFPIPLIDPVQWYTGMVSNLVYYTGGNPLSNAWSYLTGVATAVQSTTAEPVSFWSNSFLVLSYTGLAWIAVGVVVGLIAFRRVTLIAAGPFLLFFIYQCVRGGQGLGVRQFYFALPGLWIVAGAALDYVARRAGARVASPALITTAAAILLLAQPAWWAMRFLALTTRTTTVETARTEMPGLVPSGASLLVDSAAAPFGETADWHEAGIQQKDVAAGADRVREARRRAAPPFDVRELQWKDAAAELRAAAAGGRPVFVAITDYQSTAYWDADTVRVWGNISAGKAPARLAYLRDLFAATEVVRVYRPRELAAIGPTVTLLRYRDPR